MKHRKMSGIDFFADAKDSSTIYAEYFICSANKTKIEKFVKVDSPEFESYLRLVVIPKLDTGVSAKALIQEVVDHCLVYGNPDMVSPVTRTGGSLSQKIEYDLADYDQRYVQITAEGWAVTRKHDYKFLKTRRTGAQVCPVPPDKSLPKLLRPFVNTDKDSFVLFTVWLVQAFCYGNHSALLVMAEKGSGKTTLTKMLRSIIDPSLLDVSAMPSKQDNFETMLTNSYVAAFDNTALLSKEQSDLLCCAVTGATISKRVLYSTNELGVFQLHNTVILNGIDILPAESDLAERCLLLKLKKIDAEKRKLDKDLGVDFQNALPMILGAIFDALSKAMSIIGDLNPKRKPRMADSYIEMLAIAIALGVSEERFEEIYFNNLHEINKARAEAPVVEAIKEYMTSEQVTGKKVRGKMSELYKKIKDNYSGSKKALTESPSHFSRKLKAEYAALSAAGFTINIDDSQADATYLEIIKNK